MANYKSRCSLALFLLGYLMVLCLPTWAQDSVSSCQLAPEPLLISGNSRQVLKLLCAFENDGLLDDSLLILDRNSNFDIDALDPAAINFEDLDSQYDLWIYDYQDDAHFELIIDFQLSDTGLLARLYDQSENLNFPDIDNLAAKISSRRPTMLINAPDAWWQADNIINFNLDIAIDGQVVAVFVSPTQLPNLNILHDGRIDYDIRIRDRDRDGRPEYDWRSAHFESRFANGLLTDAGTNLMVNVNDDQALVRPLLLWPYLATEHFGYVSTNPSAQGQAPLQVDWASGKISYLAEMVASRADENQWFVYSFNPILPDTQNILNFENPFAWYDLAQDQDNFAELALRLVYTPANDPYFRNGNLDEPNLDIRYSWDQNNDNAWDYKIGTRGRYEISNSLELEALGFSLNTLDYNTLPAWFVAQRWDMVSFVAADGIRNLTGEGIYEGDFPPELNRFYWDGESQPVPVDAITGEENWAIFNFPFVEQTRVVDTGFRVEYSFEHLDTVELYISPIDQKLHLRNATVSIRGMNETDEIWAYDRDNDDFLDTWFYQTNAETVATIVHSPNYIVYARDDEIIFQALALAPSSYSSTAPVNHEAWQALGAVLSNQLDLDISDFRSISGQFNGGAWRLRNASLAASRYQAGAWQFIIQTANNFEEEFTNFERPNGTQLGSSRTYLLNAVGNALSITALAPINPLEDLSYSLVPVSQVEIGKTSQWVLSISNNTAQPIYGLEVDLLSQNSSETRLNEPELIQSSVFDIAPNETKGIQIAWMPPLAGTWDLSLQINTSFAPPLQANLSESAIRLDLVQIRLAGAAFLDDFLYRLSLGNQLPVFGLFVILGFLGIIIAAIAISQLFGSKS